MYRYGAPGADADGDIGRLAARANRVASRHDTRFPFVCVQHNGPLFGHLQSLKQLQ